MRDMNTIAVRWEVDCDGEQVSAIDLDVFGDDPTDADILQIVDEWVDEEFADRAHPYIRCRDDVVARVLDALAERAERER